MSTPNWSDETVAATLAEIVDDLGRRVALDPARLRAALNDNLGSRAHDLRAQVDALVVSTEAGVPSGLLRAEDPGTVRQRLATHGLDPAVVAWTVDAWTAALRIRSLGTLPPTALPSRSGPPDEPPPTAPPPTPWGPTALPPAWMHQQDLTAVPPPASAGPTALVTGAAQASTPATPGPGRRAALVGVAAALVVGLVAGGVAVAGRVRDEGATATGATTTGSGGTPAGGPTGQAPTGQPAGGPTTPAPPVVAPLTVLAHMGGSERRAPESADALVDAAKRGYAVETDVRWTSDGVAVVVHDASTKAKLDCGKNYVVAETRWSTLRERCRIKPGASPDTGRRSVVTFADATGQVAAVEGAQLFPEIKTEQSAARTRAFYLTLAQAGMLDRTVVTSRQQASLEELDDVATAAGHPVRLMLYVNDRSLSAEQVRQDGLWAVAVRYDQVTPGYVRTLHDAGAQVVAWTTDDPKEWARLRTAGVDHVLTDTPGAYLSWLATR